MNKRDKASNKSIYLQPNTISKKTLIWLQSMERPLDLFSSNLESAPLTGISINFFCPGSESRTYPLRKFNDKEAQGDNHWIRGRTRKS